MKIKQYCHSGIILIKILPMVNNLVAPMQHYLLVWPGNLCIIYQILA